MQLETWDDTAKVTFDRALLNELISLRFVEEHRTAMMAFFLVMWILGLSGSTRRAIAGYFREAGLFAYVTGKAQPLSIDNGGGQSTHRGDGSGAATGKRSSDLFDIGAYQRGTPAHHAPSPVERLQKEVAEKLRKLGEFVVQLVEAPPALSARCGWFRARWSARGRRRCRRAARA
jgi:hypothetical protein